MPREQSDEHRNALPNQIRGEQNGGDTAAVERRQRNSPLNRFREETRSESPAIKDCIDDYRQQHRACRGQNFAELESAQQQNQQFCHDGSITGARPLPRTTKLRRPPAWRHRSPVR